MKMLINGCEVDSSSGKTIDVFCPVNNQLLDTVPAATEQDMDAALEASRHGQQVWAAIPLREKEQIFRKFESLLEENKKEILTVLVKESGCSLRNGLMQIQGLPELFRGYLETAKRYDGRVLVPGTETGHDGKTEADLQIVTHEPVGTVLAIVPFNASIMLFAYKAAPALAAGNAVVVKPPTTNPLAVIMVVKLLWKAGVPGDVLQVITGNGPDIGDYMMKDPRVNAVTLTGSTEVGIHVAEIMARKLSPCALELGGNDPYIVMDDADLEKAIAQGAFWRMNSAGQICISPKRFIVHNKVKEAFTKGVLEFTKTIQMGYDIDYDAEVERYLNTDFSEMKHVGMVMNSLITEKAAKKVESQVEETLKQGATLLTGGKRHGSFYEPTVLGDVTKDMDIMKDMEIFGPVLPICGFDTMEEAIEIANQSCYGLSGCVFTKDWKKGMKMAKAIQSGGVVVNGTGTYRNMMQPFGGYKNSGLGREGFVTLGEMMQEKVIVLKDFYD